MPALVRASEVLAPLLLASSSRTASLAKFFDLTHGLDGPL